MRASPTPATLPGNCVSNLLTIDGQPIDVSVVGSTQQALNGGESQLVPCGPDAKGITLSAGPHVVQTAPGHNPPCANAPTTCTGWNIDQLALDSAPGGGPGSGAVPTASGTPQLPATQPGPAATVRQTSVHIDSHGADVTGATEPFELVLGQSVNKGWQAVATPGPGAPPDPMRWTSAGPSSSTGSPTAGRSPRPTCRRSADPPSRCQLTWTPQREIWAALAVSAATLLLCLVLGFLPLRGPPLGAGPSPPPAAGPGGSRATRAAGLPFDAAALALPGAPAEGAAPTGLAAFSSGVAHRRRSPAPPPSLVTPPWPGSWSRRWSLGLLVPWARAIASVAGIACIVAGAINVVQGQNIHHYLSGSNWAASFVNAGNLIWLGVVLLVADAIISASGCGCPSRWAGGPSGRRRASTGVGATDRGYRRLRRHATGARNRLGPWSGTSWAITPARTYPRRKGSS